MSDPDKPSAVIRIVLEGDIAERALAAVERARVRAEQVGCPAPQLREVLAVVLRRGLAKEEAEGGVGMSPDERLISFMNARELAEVLGVASLDAARAKGEEAQRNAAEAAKRTEQVFKDAGVLLNFTTPTRLVNTAEVERYCQSLRQQMLMGPGLAFVVAAALVRSETGEPAMLDPKQVN